MATTDPLLPRWRGASIQAPNWAPDSDRLAVSIEGMLFLVSRGGGFAPLDDPEGHPEQHLVPVRWTSPDELLVLDTSAQRAPAEPPSS